MNEKYFFLYTKFTERRTGVANALLARALVLQNKLGIEPIITTSDYDRNLALRYCQLLDSDLINSRMIFLNRFAYYQNTGFDLSASLQHPIRADSDLDAAAICQAVPLEDPKSIAHQIHVSRLKKFVRFYLKKGDSRLAQLEYDCQGHLSRCRILGAEETTIKEVYFRTDRSPVIDQTYDEKNGNLKSILLISPAGLSDVLFYSDQEFLKHWLLQITGEHICFLLVDRALLYEEPLRHLRRPNLITIFNIHGKHTVDNYNPITSKLSTWYQGCLENHDSLDAVVFLTDRQRQHAISRFGSHRSFFSVPNVIPNTIERVLFSNRDTKRAVVLASYTLRKNISFIIRAFKRVIELVPEARLDLYGHGDQEQNLNSLVKDLGLTESVTVNGFLQNPGLIFDSAGISLLASMSEGYPLVVMESLSHGCPVVSFDINYGPAEMINDGKNGFLVPRDDEDSFVDRIVKLFSDQKMLFAMSECAYDLASQFNQDSFSHKWKEIFNTTRQRKRSVP